MSNPQRTPRFRAAALAAVVAALLAGCTSDAEPSGTDEPTTSAATSATASTGAPSSSSQGAPAGLGQVDGALLVLGPTRTRGDVYRVSDGRIVRVTRSAGATSVASGPAGTVVGVEGSGDRETVRKLSGSRLTDLDAPGFDPAVSSTGALARVQLESASPTPGISKPGGFALVVRNSLTGKDRTILTQRQSMGSPRWLDDRRLAVAVAGDGTRVLVVDVRSGERSTIATVANADDLDLTASSRTVAVATDAGGVLVNAADRNQRAFPRGWTPLCWPTDASVLATRSGQLALVTVGTDDSVNTPRVLGTLPSGTSAFGADCGRR